MDLLWKPVVHSASRVEIPEVIASYDAAALERWTAAIDPFIRSERTEHSSFKEYAELASGGRFILPFAREAAKRRFNELHAALLLHSKGFFCWGGVSLFKYTGVSRATKGRKIDNTEEVRSRARPWRWPSEIQGLDFQPKDPDIVAYAEERNEWRFCEAKGPGEPIHSDQLKGLAVLHLLTGAPVAVVRVVEGAGAVTSQMRPTEIIYRKDAQLDWIHPKFRKRFS
jgi:hypothetical protein